MTAPNAELAYLVLDRIDANPSEWNQRDWAYKGTSCGTSYCFAGWAVVLAGRELVWMDSDGQSFADYAQDERKMLGKQWIGDAAREELGIEDSRELFHGDNTREDLGRLVAEIFGPRPDAAS